MSYAVSPSMSDDERDIDIESDVSTWRSLFSSFWLLGIFSSETYFVLSVAGRRWRRLLKGIRPVFSAGKKHGSVFVYNYMFNFHDSFLWNNKQVDKRAHHNALERKRRDHIKDSFSGLRDSVPSLQGEKVKLKCRTFLTK